VFIGYKIRWKVNTLQVNVRFTPLRDIHCLVYDCGQQATAKIKTCRSQCCVFDVNTSALQHLDFSD